MSEGVVFIFKTLIKVPIIIFTAFFIMNCFMFMFIYFKMLGFSYVLMQEVVENNYIPQSEGNQLADYLVRMQSDIPMCHNATIIVGLNGSKPVLWDNSTYSPGSMNVNFTNTMAGHNIGSKTYGNGPISNHIGARVQYGKDKTVGVHCEYEFIWPLSRQYTNGGYVEGFNGEINGAPHSSDETGTQAYNPATDSYTLETTGDLTTEARVEAENGGHAKGVVVPIDIYYTVPGLKYYADL